MATMNQNYKDKFGFPFVICARLNKKDAILNGLEQRFLNDLNVEVLTGIEEVLKICELRMRDLIVDKTGCSRQGYIRKVGSNHLSYTGFSHNAVLL